MTIREQPGEARVLTRLLNPGLFRALGDANRLAILVRLAACGRPCSVGELSSCCPVDLSTVSRHLAVLRRAGVVSAEKRGKHVFYAVRGAQLADVLRRLADALDRCCGRGCCAPAPTDHNKEDDDVDEQ